MRSNRKLATLFIIVLMAFILVSGGMAFDTYDSDYMTPENLYIKAVTLANGHMTADVDGVLRTHPWLTLKAIELFEYYYGLNLSLDARAEIIYGSIEEDIDVAGSSNSNCYARLGMEDNIEDLDVKRAQNHFYSGTTNLWVYDDNGELIYGRLTDPPFVQGFSVCSDVEYYSARKWAYDAAENSYNWNTVTGSGNISKRWRAVGHVLHLLEDMGVPAHVRNDNHVDPTKYNLIDPISWRKDRHERILSALSFIHSEDFNGSISPITIKGLVPEKKTELVEYFDAMADETQANFYSVDTVGINSYQDMNFITVQKSYQAVAAPTGTGFYIYLINANNSSPYKGTKLATASVTDTTLALRAGAVTLAQVTSYLANTPDEEKYHHIIDEWCVRDYWSRMAPRIIENAAGVIALAYEKIVGPLQPPTSSLTGDYTCGGGYYRAFAGTYEIEYPLDCTVNFNGAGGYRMTARYLGLDDWVTKTVTGSYSVNSQGQVILSGVPAFTWTNDQSNPSCRYNLTWSLSDDGSVLARTLVPYSDNYEECDRAPQVRDVLIKKGSNYTNASLTGDYTCGGGYYRAFAGTYEIEYPLDCTVNFNGAGGYRMTARYLGLDDWVTKTVTGSYSVNSQGQVILSGVPAFTWTNDQSNPSCRYNLTWSLSDDGSVLARTLVPYSDNYEECDRAPQVRDVLIKKGSNYTNASLTGDYTCGGGYYRAFAGTYEIEYPLDCTVNFNGAGGYRMTARYLGLDDWVTKTVTGSYSVNSQGQVILSGVPAFTWTNDQSNPSCRYNLTWSLSDDGSVLARTLVPYSDNYEECDRAPQVRDVLIKKGSNYTTIP